MTHPEKKEEDDILGPAVITPMHRRDRGVSKGIGAPKAWRKMSALEAAYDKGQLAGGNPAYNAEARYEAGMTYAQMYLTAQASGRDSTDMDRIMSRGGGGLPLSIAQIDAIRSLVSVDSHLGTVDRKIIRMVCGEEYTPAKAIAEVDAGYKNATLVRFRESLDALIEAFETVNKHGQARRGSFNLDRTA